jgi:hypothetical protein
LYATAALQRVETIEFATQLGRHAGMNEVRSAGYGNQPADYAAGPPTEQQHVAVGNPVSILGKRNRP